MSLTRFRGERPHRQPEQLPVGNARPEIDDRATDPAVFADLDRRFRFTVDAAAWPHNAKLSRYWTILDDGLAQDWTGERVWCNPPYSNIEPWVVKAATGGADLAVMLLPANRTEQGWWHRHVEPHRDRPGGPRLEFLAGRMRFIAPGRTAIGPNERPPFGVCLLIWTRS